MDIDILFEKISFRPLDLPGKTCNLSLYIGKPKLASVFLSSSQVVSNIISGLLSFSRQLQQ